MSGPGSDGLRVRLRAATHTEWLILALDRCATDMAKVAAKSVKYLKTIA
jgi:hypothetical protein